MRLFLQDMSVARRSLARQGGLWTLAVLTLAAGVGVNSSVYALLRNIFDRPLLVLRDPGTVMLQAANAQQGRDRRPLTRAEFRYWRDHSNSYSLLAGYDAETFSLGGEPGAERVQATRVTADFFAVIGAKMLLGRGFEARDFSDGGSRSVVLSHAFWQRRFGGDRGIVGSTIRLDREAYVVSGVAADDVWWPTVRNSLWMPMPAVQSAEAEGKREVNVLGVLRKAVTREQAQAEMTAMMQAVGGLYPESSGGWSVSVRTPYDALFSTNDRLARPLLFLLAGCVLLLACANVANLLLVRSIGRRREMAIRRSMGAGLGALARQITAESLWLAAPACAAAVLFADWSVPLLLKGFPGLEIQVPKNPVDYSVVAFTAAVSVAAIFVFSMAPVWQAQRTNIADAMRSAGARTGADRRSRRLSSAFVVVQAALAMGLVGSALLVSKAMYQAVHLDPGFNMKNVLQVRADLARSRYGQGQTYAYFEQAVGRVRGLPGVVSASAISAVPYVEGNGVATSCALDGMNERKDRLPQATVITVLPGAMETLQIPLRRGRGIDARDDARAPGTIVVNEAAVRRLWPGRDPIGQRVRIDALGGRWFTVAGVAGDVRRTNPVQRIEPLFFVPAAQAPARSMAVVVRTAGPPEASIPAIRAALQALDPEEPLVVDTVEAAAYRGIQGGVTFAGLLCVMGGLSLFLSAIGLFSILAYHVWDRTRDIGVRIALGASRVDIVRRFAAQVLWLAVPGLVLGIVLAVMLGKRVEAVLYGVAVTEPVVLGGAVAALFVATLTAAVVPARRAASVDPGTALRQE